MYVDDGLDEWISVPINLNSGDEVVAGMLSVDFPDGLEYKECRAGVLFEDMYVTLRFEVTNENYKQ